MKIALGVLQVVLLVIGAPLLRGIVGRLKAVLQRRQGSPIWRPYADIWKLLHKEDLVPPSATAVFSLAPLLLLVTSILATAFVPLLANSALLGSTGDFILMVYMLAFGRFFLALGGMDGGSAFGGMGASREALVSSLAEAPLLLGLAAVAIQASSASIVGMTQWALERSFFNISAVHLLAFLALGIVALAETGRMPVDNPTTHLELTMIHEGMVLEYSGPNLALIEWAGAIKLSFMAGLLIALFAPWGMATALSPPAMGLAAVAMLAKMFALAATLAVIESGIAKLRMYAVPDFLGVAAAVGTLAVIFTALMKR
ncbi:MAG TPA: NADH-quinone oxidoreductase subunit H [Terriglobia bacterium]|nr:NADH-quinone oxidoreductase subunit H [Terriglobia bacterium]